MTSIGYTLDRRAVVAAMLADRDEHLLVVAGLGSSAWDITAAGDTALNFPLWGAMGGAVMVGLGLALAQPTKRVFVVTGDGEMLMGLAALATIGRQQPNNLAVVVLDNEHYGETGMQPTHTGAGTDLAAVAHACGWPKSLTVSEASGLAEAVCLARAEPGPVFIVAKVSTDPQPLVLPERDGTWLKERFRRAVLGSASGSRGS